MWTIFKILIELVITLLLFPLPGIEPISCALKGKALTTGPSGKSLSFFFFSFFNIVFTYLFLPALVFAALHGLFSSCREWGYSLLQSMGFSLQGLLWLQSTGSRHSSFSSCSSWAQQLWHMSLVALWHVESSWTRDQTCIPCTGRWILIPWAN